MKGKKILVCGAGGFIGSHLAQKLFKEGHFVRVVDIKWDGYLPEPYYSEKLTLDLRNLDNCRKVTKGIDYVFQLAADMGGIGYITQVGADIMINSGLINIHMLKAAIENKVQRFFFSSSACVYPEGKQMVEDLLALKEDDAYPAEPDTFYGWEKLMMEQLCEATKEDYGLEIRIARFHNIYGPEGTFDGGKEKAPAAISRKIAKASNNDTIPIWGDGKQTRSFLYIDDCLRGIIALMKSNHDDPINIGSDRLVTITELADMVISASGKKIEKEYDLTKPQGVRGRNADLSLVKKVLGWEPEISLEEGMSKTYDWINKQYQKVV